MQAVMGTVDPPGGNLPWTFDHKKAAAILVTKYIEEYHDNYLKGLHLLNERMEFLFRRTGVEFHQHLKSPGKRIVSTTTESSTHSWRTPSLQKNVESYINGVSEIDALEIARQLREAGYPGEDENGRPKRAPHVPAEIPKSQRKTSASSVTDMLNLKRSAPAPAAPTMTNALASLSSPKQSVPISVRVASQSSRAESDRRAAAPSPIKNPKIRQGPTVPQQPKAEEPREDETKPQQPERESVAQPEQPAKPARAPAAQPEQPAKPAREVVAKPEQPAKPTREMGAKPEQPAKPAREVVAKPEQPAKGARAPVAQPEQPVKPAREAVAQPEQSAKPSIEQPADPLNQRYSEVMRKMKAFKEARLQQMGKASPQRMVSKRTYQPESPPEQREDKRTRLDEQRDDKKTRLDEGNSEDVSMFDVPSVLAPPKRQSRNPARKESLTKTRAYGPGRTTTAQKHAVLKTNVSPVPTARPGRALSPAHTARPVRALQNESSPHTKGHGRAPQNELNAHTIKPVRALQAASPTQSTRAGRTLQNELSTHTKGSGRAPQNEASSRPTGNGRAPHNESSTRTTGTGRAPHNESSTQNKGSGRAAHNEASSRTTGNGRAPHNEASSRAAAHGRAPQKEASSHTTVKGRAPQHEDSFLSNIEAAPAKTTTTKKSHERVTTKTFQERVAAFIEKQEQLKAAKPPHPIDTIQIVNGRIPFAEITNPPAAPANVASEVKPAGGKQKAAEVKPANETTAAPPPETPVRLYPPGDGVEISRKLFKPVRFEELPRNADQLADYWGLPAHEHPLKHDPESIVLPEIFTDSEDEDEDDENKFVKPDWAADPTKLEYALRMQSLVDPETVFGKQKPLDVDDMFGRWLPADRLAALKSKRESSDWSKDGLKSADKRRAQKTKENVVKNGGWYYGCDKDTPQKE